MLTNFATARAAAAGVVYTVNSTADTDDGACTNTFNGCTLREAINAANASIATKDTIAFNIPGPGVKTISPIRVMPIITDSVTIDGYSGGVVVSFDQNNNAIRSNRIFENRDLGIDLGSDRVTPNDPGDGDAGPNNRQNFPVISMATFDSSNGDLTVQATLNSSPSTAFDVEFFSNDRCDETGHGEGQFFLGSTTATTDAGGNVSFSHVARLSMTSAGSFITATAIDPNGNTSEFSRCVYVPAAQPNPTPTPPPLQLILEESGPAPAQAVALDSALLIRDPFPLINTANLLNRVDRNTRVILFVANLQLAQGESPSSVVVNLVDGNSQSYEVSAEHVRPVPNFNFVQVVFRLPDNLPLGTCLITVRARGQVSNVGSIRIRIRRLKNKGILGNPGT